MAHQRVMKRLAKWHIWLGWLVGVPLLIWTLSGLAMVARPIETVRGSDLRRELPQVPLPHQARGTIALPATGTRAVVATSTRVEHGEVVTRVTYLDGSSDRFRADGARMGPTSEAEARRIVAAGIVGGDRIAAVSRFAADSPPLEFRRALAAWQVALEDGTHVYVGIDSGEIEAVRTRWWRFYDVMWGLHIMDLQTREDSHNPILIAFAALAAGGTLMGCILMFRRRRARPKAAR